MARAASSSGKSTPAGENQNYVQRGSQTFEKFTEQQAEDKARFAAESCWNHFKLQTAPICFSGGHEDYVSAYESATTRMPSAYVLSNGTPDDNIGLNEYTRHVFGCQKNPT